MSEESRPGTAPSPETSPPQPLRTAPARRELVLVLGFAFFLYLTLGTGLELLSPRLGVLATQGLAIALPAIAAVRLFYLDPRAVLPFGRPEGRTLAAAVLGAACLNHLLGIYGAWQERFSPTPDAIRDLFADLLQARSPLEFALVLLFFACVPALCEELLFRGFVQAGVMRQVASRGAGLAIGALLFAVFHLDPWRFTGVFVLGLFFGWLRLRSGSLWPGVVAHAVNNALSIGLARAGWLSEARAPGSAWTALLAAAGCVAAIALTRPRGAGIPIDRML